MRIHAKKRGVDVSKYKKEEWNALIENTDKFVGAELEQLICDARFMSFAARRTGQPTIDEMLTTAAKVIPLATSEAKVIAEIEAMCKDRARPVSREAVITDTSKPSKQATRNRATVVV